MADKKKFRVKHGLEVNTQSGSTQVLKYPTADGLLNQVIKTDGSGNLSFDSLGGGGGGSFISLSDTPISYSGGAGRAIVVNDSANALVFSQNPVSSSLNRHQFTGTGSQTRFAMGTAYAGQNYVLVFVDGVIQYPSTNFSLDSVDIVFTSAPLASADIVIMGTVTAAGFPSGSVDSNSLSSPLTTPGALTVKGHLLPHADSTYDLGSSSAKWKDLHLSGSTIFIGKNRIRSDGNKIRFQDSVGANNNEFSARKVGIGTQSPSIELDVVGDVAVTSGTDAKLTINDNIGEVGSGNLALQVSNSGGSALKPMGFRGEDIRFATGASERLRIDSTGYIGINQDAPLARLDIKGNTTTFDGMSKIYLTDANSNAASRNWSLGNGGSGFGNLTFAVSAAKDGNAGDATATNAMVITSDGNVGINTATIDANNFGAGAGILTVASETGSAKTAMLNLVGDGNDTDATRVASVFFNDASATGAGATLAGIEAYRASNHATDPGADLIFSTNSSSTAYAERMRIEATGNVLIGTTTDDGSSKLQVNGNISPSGHVNIDSASGSINFGETTTSDGKITFSSGYGRLYAKNIGTSGGQAQDTVFKWYRPEGYEYVAEVDATNSNWSGAKAIFRARAKDTNFGGLSIVRDNGEGVGAISGRKTVNGEYIAMYVSSTELTDGVKVFEAENPSNGTADKFMIKLPLTVEQGIIFNDGSTQTTAGGGASAGTVIALQLAFG